MKKFIFLHLITALVCAQTFASVSKSDSRKNALKKIQRSCERGIERPKILGERIAFCACVVRNHSAQTETKELKLIERIYSKQIDPNEPTTNDESVVADFDMDVAASCLANPKYNVSK